jgi:pentapeptide repeat protein
MCKPPLPSKAVLTKANLTGAVLTDANLNEAVLTNANLSYADLTGATLVRADYSSANLMGTIWPARTIPDPWKRGGSGRLIPRIPRPEEAGDTTN